MSESEFRARLGVEGLYPGAWANGPGDRYATHDHPYDKVIVVAAGSITFGLPDLASTLVLETGDRLDLPFRIRHDAVVGPSGVACLEAHAPAGSLGPTPTRHETGTW